MAAAAVEWLAIGRLVAGAVEWKPVTEGLWLMLWLVLLPLPLLQYQTVKHKIERLIRNWI